MLVRNMLPSKFISWASWLDIMRTKVDDAKNYDEERADRDSF